MLDNFSFEYPYILLIVLLFVLCSYVCKKKRSFLYFPSFGISSNHKKTRYYLKYIGVVSIIVALASPITTKINKSIKKDGYSCILVLDASGSMREKVSRTKTRFDISKEIIKEFVTSRINDEIGLTVFGSYSFIASPLTYDKKSLNEILSRMEPTIAGSDTSIYDALFSSIKLLKKSKSKSKFIILLTDGVDRTSKIPSSVVTKLAKKHNIKIYTVGITDEVDKYTLDNISNSTNAKSFIANSIEELKNIYKTINKLEKSKIDQNKITMKNYYYQYPLSLGLLSFFSFWFF